ncbi:aldehyde dehydrogenase family protein [Nocardia sp. NPDC051929]|uniref:aldehyde dehydrogenase family protein n=1 Tax=unclassified Nocardia TaxID=2637762 RepID=UPI00341A5328
MPELVDIDALGAHGVYRSCRRSDIVSLAGDKIGEISQVPPVYIRRTLAAMRAATTPHLADRITMLNKAADIYATGTLFGLAPGDYARVVSRVSGVPLPVVIESIDSITEALRTVQFRVESAMPRGAVSEGAEPKTRNGAVVWTRKGHLFAVHAPGNTPAAHGLWPEALALGYAVAVRPSNREPFTPARLVAALREAGFDERTITLLPTDHATAEVVVTTADYAIVYGGQDVINTYAHNRRVLLQGPGRSKILVTNDVDWRDMIDVIADSVSGHGGAACVCATAVLVEDDPAPLARALAEKLARIPSLPSDHPESVLTVQPVERARQIDAQLRRTAQGTRAWLGGDTIVDELPGGGAVLRPAVHQVATADAPQLQAELPSPCVWVGPWQPEDGIAPLKNSLVLTAMTEDRQLIENLRAEPSITNLYLGGTSTTHKQPNLPHDGYLGEGLMRTKAMIGW